MDSNKLYDMIIANLDLTDNRDKQIKDILDLGKDNPYCKKLCKIYMLSKSGELSQTQTIILINAVIGEYIFNVVMPEEDRQIAEQRKQAENDNLDELEPEPEPEDLTQIGIVSGVPIYNPDDKAEVAIKDNITIGQCFNTLKSMYDTVGIDNLGVKNLNGGKQKATALSNLLQYVDLQGIDGKIRARQIADIYEVPHYLEKEDNRGKNGFYIDRIIPIMVNFLSDKEDSMFFTNVTKLSKIMGIVGRDFKTKSYEDLAKINPKFTYAMTNQLYCRCKPEQESIVYRILDRLQDDYSVISYYRNFYIQTENGNYTSSKEEDVLIRKTQRKVLDEFGAKSITTIFYRKQQTAFFNRVCEVINDTYGYKWIKYNQQIQIYVDAEGLAKILPQFIMDEVLLKQNKVEVAQRFYNRISKITEKDYVDTNQKADKTLQEWKEDFDKSELKELIDLGFDYAKEVKEIKPKPYKYHDNYLEVQRQLMSILIGLPEEQTLPF